MANSIQGPAALPQDQKRWTLFACSRWHCRGVYRQNSTHSTGKQRSETWFYQWNVQMGPGMYIFSYSNTNRPYIIFYHYNCLNLWCSCGGGQFQHSTRLFGPKFVSRFRGAKNDWCHQYNFCSIEWDDRHCFMEVLHDTYHEKPVSITRFIHRVNNQTNISVKM